MIVTLNEAEQALARAIAEARMTSAAAAGSKDMTQGKLPPEVMDLEGAGAEVAFCKIANVWPDTEPGAKAVDAWTRYGVAVDVKSTSHEAGRLLAVRWKKRGDVAVYVLMVGKFPTYRCAGFLDSDELLRNERLKDLGRGLTYCASQDELDQIEALIGD